MSHKKHIIFLLLFIGCAFVPVAQALSYCRITDNVGNGASIFFGEMRLQKGDEIPEKGVVMFKCSSTNNSSFERSTCSNDGSWNPSLSKCFETTPSPLVDLLARFTSVFVRMLFTIEEQFFSSKTRKAVTFLPDLQQAVVSDNVNEVKRLLELQSTVVDAKYPESSYCNWTLTNATALIWASACNWKGSYEISTMLIKAGANVNAREAEDFSALIYASRSGGSEIVRLLLDHDAALEDRCVCDYTALMWAANEGYIDIVKLLIERGADVNAYDTDNNYPLRLAAQGNHTEVVRLLRDAGAKDMVQS